MAQLVAVRPASTGTVITGAAVSASDTIQASDLGSNGAFLIVNNAGGSPDTVATSDSGATPAGNSSTGAGGSVAAGAVKGFYIDPKAVNPSTGVVTVTHSFTTSVTYTLYPLG